MNDNKDEQNTGQASGGNPQHGGSVPQSQSPQQGGENSDKVSQTENKLDLWLKQKMQEGSSGEPANQKIVHLPAPQNGKKPFLKKPNFMQGGQKPNEKKHFQPNVFRREPKFSQSRFTGKLKVIPLSGLNEVGRNCMVLEYFRDAKNADPKNKNAKSDIIVIDMGFQFPDADFLGVDYVLPDTSYLEERKERIRAIIFTHGHLDHIGGVPYIIPKLNYPEMYGTQLTMGLIEKKLKEFGLTGRSRVNVITSKDKLKLGPFEIDFFNVTHSIPDAVGIVVKTPAGNMVHTGDFKFDLTPAAGQKVADFDKISGLSHQEIAALFIDSTNANKPGHTVTEQKIGESLDAIVKNTESRIIIASFSSQIGRIQQIVNIAQKYGRKILLSGRSLEENFEMASKLGYLRYSPNLVIPIHKAKKINDHEALILTTGSQGEDVSALTRMSMEEHSIVKIKKGDMVILSSSPIPGNERAVFTVINNLTRLGANVIDNKIMDVHTSGHAQEEDLKLMMTLVRPKAVVPIHGEFYMRAANKRIAMNLGYTDEQALIIENGEVLEIENNEIRRTTEKVSSNYVLIDGLGVGDIGAQVIMDRQTLAENGVLIIMVPVDEKTGKLKGQVDIISRGFIYMKESEALVAEMTKVAEDAFRGFTEKQGVSKRAEVKKYIRDTVDKFVHQKLERYPLILPIIVER